MHMRKLMVLVLVTLSLLTLTGGIASADRGGIVILSKSR